VADPQLFVAQVMGTRGYMSTQDVSNYLRSMVVTRLTDLLGENMRTMLDLPAMYDEVAAATRVRVRDDFASLGLLLKQLYILSVSPTEETSAAIDEAASMGAIGDMDRYLKFKAARAVGDSAAAGGGAGEGTQLGMGLGTGLAMAKILSEGISGSSQQGQAAGAAAPAAADPVALLKKLKEMLDAGLISQAEYDSKKTEILSRM
jgi:membrane protease subunit (stomatin/prohibitin family)